MRDIMLILHFIGLAMGLGTAFAHMFIGILVAKTAISLYIEVVALIVILQQLH